MKIDIRNMDSYCFLKNLLEKFDSKNIKISCKKTTIFLSFGIESEESRQKKSDNKIRRSKTAWEIFGRIEYSFDNADSLDASINQLVQFCRFSMNYSDEYLRAHYKIGSNDIRFLDIISRFRGNSFEEFMIFIDLLGY